MKVKSIFTVLFLVWGLTGALAQISLSFNPERGARYEYHTEATQNIKQSVMGQEIPTTVIMNTKYLMEIVDKTAQEVTVRFTYSELEYILSSPMMVMAYDSKSPAENLTGIDQMLGRMFGGMIGQSLTAVFAPDGSVKSVTGMEAIGENMVRAVANDGPMGAQFGAQMRQQFNDDAIKGMFEQSFKLYPAGTVSVGASWDTEIMTMASNMNVGVKTKYTLREVNNNIATVAVEGETEMTIAGMEGKIAGTQTGTMTINTRTGIPATGEITQNARGTIVAQEMNVQMEMVSNVKMTIRAL